MTIGLAIIKSCKMPNVSRDMSLTDGMLEEIGSLSRKLHMGHMQGYSLKHS